MQKYCFLSAEQSLKALGSGADGLSAEEAAARLRRYGANVIESGKHKGVVALFFSQFKDFMTLLLVVAAAVSGAIAAFSGEAGDLTDTAIILAIILLNAAVGTVQQFRADRAIENLKKLSACRVRVKRDGSVSEVGGEQVTVGDILLFEEGDAVPADCRIIECSALRCDESALTGESVSVDKSAERIHADKVGIGGMTNTLFASTFVVSGSAAAVVERVGMETETGKIAAMLSESGAARTPLEKSLAKLGKALSAAVLAVCAVIFVFGLFVSRDGVLHNFMTSVAVAVAAIPEGLPAVVTIIMAMGVQRMSRKAVVIRRLKAVETLGCCSVICTDKTGTLTENRLKVAAVRSADGRSPRNISGANVKLMQCIVCCNAVKGERGGYIGDPTEIALRVYADECGFSEGYTLLDTLPFTSERRMMSVAADFGGGAEIYSKGAADVLADRCSFIFAESGVRAITAADKRRVCAECDSMSAEGLRVLGFAYRSYGGVMEENGLVFVGLCGMSDGLKRGVDTAVRDCRTAGIRTVMITGDHVKTAFAIARRAGIAKSFDEVITGEQIDDLQGEEQERALCSCSVFARVSPRHKNMIVNALQRRGEVVAMTGDGVNDAPSIKSADIGIAMGSGTDVTKSASDMVIADDNFTSIVAGVREGRRISANIRKTILFFLSTNLAEVLSILIVSLALFRYEFLLSTQLLWLNLITDSFPVLALGVEREDRDIMLVPPVRAERLLFSKSTLAAIAFYGGYMTVATVGVFAASLHIWGNECATAVTFLTVSFLELFQAFNIRSERQSAFRSGALSNKLLLFTVAFGVAVNVILAYTPLAAAFGLVSLNGAQWLTVFALSLSVIPAGELYKAAVRAYSRGRRKREDGAAARQKRAPA